MKTDDQGSEQVQIALAKITANGISLFDKLYTNDRMIRFRWFEHAERNGEWQIPVAFYSSNLNCIFLLDFKGVEIATSLETPASIEPEVKEVYFKAIQNLKEQLFRQEHRK